MSAKNCATPALIQNRYLLEIRMLEDFDLINDICRWLFTVCSLILLYFGFLVFTKVRRERKWGEKYKRSLDTLTEYDVKSHETLRQYVHHEKEKKVQKALQQLVDAAHEETGDVEEQETEYKVGHKRMNQTQHKPQQASKYEPHIDSGYYSEYEPEEETKKEPQQTVRIVDKDEH